MKYPNKCSRCGFCCIAETCQIGRKYFGINVNDICPALNYSPRDKMFSCTLVRLEIVPSGDGCCILARAYKDGVEYDFASLPDDLKLQAALSALIKKTTEDA